MPKDSYRPVIERTKHNVEQVINLTNSIILRSIKLAAFEVTVGLLGWSFLQKREDDLAIECIPILLASPKVGHLPAITADILVNVSAELRQLLSKRATLTVFTDSDTDSPLGTGFELVLSAVGLPEPDRISVELLDVETYAIAWVDAYRLDTGLTAQRLDALVSRVSDDLFPQIVSRSKVALDMQPLEELNPWELYLLSTWVPGAVLSTLDWEVQRRDIARRAVTLDPQLGQAHSVLADKLAHLSCFDDNYHSTETVDDAHFHAMQTLQLTPRDTNTLFNMSIHHWHLDKNQSAVQMFDRIKAIDSSNGFAALLTMVFHYTCTTAPNGIAEAAGGFDSQLKADNPIL